VAPPGKKPMFTGAGEAGDEITLTDSFSPF